MGAILEVKQLKNFQVFKSLRLKKLCNNLQSERRHEKHGLGEFLRPGYQERVGLLLYDDGELYGVPAPFRHCEGCYA